MRDQRSSIDYGTQQMSTTTETTEIHYSKLDDLLAHVAFSATRRATEAFIPNACGARHRQGVLPVRARAGDGASPLALSARHKARTPANATILHSG